MKSKTKDAFQVFLKYLLNIFECLSEIISILNLNQVAVAQWLVRELSTSEVGGSNDDKGDILINF